MTDRVLSVDPAAGNSFRQMCVKHPPHRSIGLTGRQPKFFEQDQTEGQLLVHGAAQLFIWERVRQMGIPKGLAPGCPFGYFSGKGKVPRRRPTQSIVSMTALPCPTGNGTRRRPPPAEALMLLSRRRRRQYPAGAQKSGTVRCRLCIFLKNHSTNTAL